MSRRAAPPAGLSAGTEATLRHWREAVPNDRLAHLVRDAARGVTRALQLRLAGHGVSFGHWVFLRILWEQDGLTQRELSVRAGLTEPTAFSALRAMERLGTITREHKPDSRKKIYIRLTPEGRALKDRLVPLAEDVNRVAVRAVPAEEVATARRVLLAMIQNLAEDEVSLARHDLRMPSTRALSQGQRRRETDAGPQPRRTQPRRARPARRETTE